MCRAEVGRWQAAKRQQRWRADANNRARQADRERVRRQALREQAQGCQLPPLSGAESLLITLDATTPAEPAVLSRNSKIPEDFCDRPGCVTADEMGARLAELKGAVLGWYGFDPTEAHCSARYVFAE